MLINSLSFGNYNASTLVNNPPYITNYPFYEYMRDNKLDFESTDLKMTKKVIRKTEHTETQKDNFMTGVFVATAGAVGITACIGKNRLKAGYRKLADCFNRTFHH